MTPGSRKYELLKNETSAHENDEQLQQTPCPILIKSNCKLAAIVILMLVISNLWTISVASYFFKRASGPGQSPLSASSEPETSGYRSHDDQSYPVLDELPVHYTRFKWWTAWGLEAGATNDTHLPSAHVADELWEGILSSHGIVAVDRQWAKERNWPEAMYLPRDPHGKEKGVYLLEAYHLMHCLKIIRLSFVEARRGLPLTWPVGHTTHCFDAMRQSIQCNADNTPLHTFGDSTAGDGQLRKCKSWDALREWATEHSACYVDSVSDIPLRDHFVSCKDGRPYQNGQDGLP